MKKNEEIKKKSYLKSKARNEILGFKEFIIDTNLMGLAIGFLMGASFRNVILTIINELVIPGLASGMAVEDIMLGSIRIGLVYAAIIEFTITAITVYIIFKVFRKIGLNKSK